MNVLQNLVGLYNCLPMDSTYRNVCKGILMNLEESANATIYDIAELTNSSRTTVWRMVQKMGYENFRDFHHDLKKAVHQYTYYNRILPMERASSQNGICEAFLGQTLAAYEIMKEYIKADEIAKVASELFHADKISIYIPYQNAALYSLQQNLSMSKIETNYFSLYPDMLEDSKHLTEKTIVFVNLVEHAETMDMDVLFQNLKESQAKIYMVADPKSGYKKYVDKVLLPYKGKTDIAGEMIIFDMYIYALSEIFRLNYLERK